MRVAAVSLLVGALLIAPGIWAFDTLGHKTSGTFPAGGPELAASIGPPGLAGGHALGGGPFGVAPLGRAGRGAVSGHGGPPSGAFGPFGGAPGGSASRAGAGGPGGFGGASLTSVTRFVDAHGSGTIAVASQSGAASAILASGAQVAGIGGFSGRESDVAVAWLAQRVRAGSIRWVFVESGAGGAGAAARGRRLQFLGSRPSGAPFGGPTAGPRPSIFGHGTGGLPGDNRQGSTVALGAAAKACVKVDTGSTSSGALYDCAGRASALEAKARESTS